MLKRFSQVSKGDRKESTISAGHGKPHSCGIGSCQPESLQGCANVKAYCAVLSIMMLLHFVYFSYAIGVVRTVEKRFGLPSYQTGVIQSASDIIQVVLVIIVGYMGRKTHKPRYLSISVLFSAAGILLSASPYFIYGPAQYDTASLSNYNKMTSSVDGYNNGKVTNSSASPYVPEAKTLSARDHLATIDYQMCGEDQDSNHTQENGMGECGSEAKQLAGSSKTAFYIFLVSSLLLGFGTSGLLTLGISFIDENVKKEDSAIYVGVTTSMFAWGPIIGFSLAAFCTRLPEDLGEMKVSPFDPAFIGCWWLGHVIVGSLLLVICIPMYMFPKHFREYYIYCKTDRKPKFGRQKSTITSELKEFPKALWKLLSNPAYMILCFSKVFAMYYIVGIIINLSRYLEIHYGKPAFVANIAIAVCGALCGAAGNIVGGIIMKKFQMGEKGSSLLYTFALSSIVVGLIAMMSMPCTQPPTAYDGVATMTKTGYNLDSQCNAECSCSRDQYQRVCSPEGVEYFSPCHAGCRSRINGTKFTECSCLPDETSHLSGEWCGWVCNLFVPYIVTYALVSFFGSMSNVPVTILTFRLVEPELKAFALGLVSALYNVLVFVPGPILYGALFDSACVIWKTACGERMSCLVYDTTKYRQYMHGLTIAFEACALILTIVLHIVIRRRLHKDHSVDKNENEVENLNSKPLHSDDDEETPKNTSIYTKA